MLPEPLVPHKCDINGLGLICGSSKCRSCKVQSVYKRTAPWFHTATMQEQSDALFQSVKLCVVEMNHPLTHTYTHTHAYTLQSDAPFSISTMCVVKMKRPLTHTHTHTHSTHTQTAHKHTHTQTAHARTPQTPSPPQSPALPPPPMPRHRTAFRDKLRREFATTPTAGSKKATDCTRRGTALKYAPSLSPLAVIFV